MAQAESAISDVIDELDRAAAPRRVGRRPSPLRVLKEAEHLERLRFPGGADDEQRIELVAHAAWRQLTGLADPELRAAEAIVLTRIVAAIGEDASSAERSRVKRFARQRISRIDAIAGGIDLVRSEVDSMIATVRFRVAVTRQIDARTATGELGKDLGDLARRWSTAARFDPTGWDAEPFVDHVVAVEAARLAAPPVGEGDVRLRRADLRAAWSAIEAHLVELLRTGEHDDELVGAAWAKAKARLEWDDRLELPPPEHPRPWVRQILRRARVAAVSHEVRSAPRDDLPAAAAPEEAPDVEIGRLVPLVGVELAASLVRDLDEAGITLARIIELHDPAPLKRGAFRRVIAVSEVVVEHLDDEVHAGAEPPGGAPGPTMLVLCLALDDLPASGLRLRVFHARCETDPTYATDHADGPPRSIDGSGAQPGAYQELRRLTAGSTSRNAVVGGGVRWVVEQVLERALHRCGAVVHGLRAGEGATR